VKFWRYRVAQLGVLLVALALAFRLLDIQVARHEEFRQLADNQWKHRLKLPPRRGNLYDRGGRPLALSVTQWRLGIAAKKVAEPESLALRFQEILDEPPAPLARRIRAAGDSHLVVRRKAVLSPDQLAALRQLDAITLEDLATRVYPLGGVGASLIGFFRNDGENGDITTGLEQSLASYLAGIPGEAWRLESALPGQTLGQIVRREPVHGRHVVLTIDADLQQLCEDQLARSVAACGARGGAVLIADPWTGDILAAASAPLLADRAKPVRDAAVWNNFNFTGVFEPGSVFKIFTAASLLRNGAIDTATVFDCRDPGPYGIRNCESHRDGPISFMPGFIQSNNVFFVRASENLGREEFYRDLVQFGFGQPTRAPYGAQSAGILRPPSQWSGRSKATIAIGQEIAVTPLQLMMATCAIANGGYLFAPRMVREIHAPDGKPEQVCDPIPLRRVISEPLAELLRGAMRRVVAEGTGRAAHLDWIELGGKTGTAQKCLDGRGYAPGKFMASFVGCAPIAEPRLVILAVLDEPDYAHHYAAQSAVPLFAEIVRDIRRTTDWLTGPDGPAVLPARVAHADVAATVPDLLYLSTATAASELRRCGLVVRGGEKPGWVIGQVPGPGASCCRGDTIGLVVAAQRGNQAAVGSLCPDLRGLSNREIESLAARLGIPVRVSGVGYVKGQNPSAGQPIGPGGIKVRMAASWR
jgi:stage V sporulation protein D (sporulation-specific penicillin-binding protein)